MLSVGAVHVRHDEVVCFEYRPGSLSLVLDWPATDLPVLFEVAHATRLEFDHLAGGGGPLPIEVRGWRAEPRPRRRTAVRLVLHVPGAC